MRVQSKRKSIESRSIVVLAEELFGDSTARSAAVSPGAVMCRFRYTRLPIDQLHVPLGKEGMEQVVVLRGFGRWKAMGPIRANFCIGRVGPDAAGECGRHPTVRGPQAMMQGVFYAFPRQSATGD